MTQDQFSALISAINSLNRTTSWLEVASFIVMISAFIVSTAALVFLAKQIKVAVSQAEISRRQLLEDHERSRRQLAMEMCFRWTSARAPESSSVVRLLEAISREQNISIEKLLPTSLEDKHEMLIFNSLCVRFPEIEQELPKLKKGNYYELSTKHVNHIRFIAVRYLNTLESCLLAWHTNTADTKIMMDEFAHIFDESRDATCIMHFRNKAGMKSFPAISAFLIALGKGDSTAAQPRLGGA